ncbi:MAG: hypothetical protein EAZ79_29145 [Oscillatoriales cyanobacterium]|nr:MAG: hypothetical protein EAZ79_29145 [Oscillatoriales cyanobacterium]
MPIALFPFPTVAFFEETAIIYDNAAFKYFYFTKLRILVKIKFNLPLPLSKIYPKSPDKSIGNNSFFFGGF